MVYGSYKKEGKNLASFMVLQMFHPLLETQIVSKHHSWIPEEASVHKMESERPYFFTRSTHSACGHSIRAHAYNHVKLLR